MAMLESTDPLWLWKFAKASEKLRERASVLVFDPLDEFALYLATGHQYPAFELTEADQITFGPGAGLEVREQIVEQLDPHGVAAFIEGYAIEVWAISDMELPIYTTPMPVGLQRPVVVEGGLPIPVWVMGQEDIDLGLVGIQHELIDMVAFWIWQFESVISAFLERFVGTQNAFTIELLLVDPPSWVHVFEVSELEDAEGRPSIAGVEPTWAGMTIAINSSCLSAMNGPSNDGEREFIREMLLHMTEILSADDSISLKEKSISNINEAIETVAALGNKKKLVITSRDPIFYHDLRSLPTFRPVQEADRNEILASVDEQVVSGSPENTKLGSTVDRKETANKAVKFLYSELVHLVSSYDATDLLNKLIASNESNTQRRAQWDLTVPTRIACFGRREDLLLSLVEETRSIDAARIANRFLIEYAAASPPCGHEFVSLADYDRLLALASALVYFGTISDYAHFGLGDVDGASAPSGQLEVGRAINAWSRFGSNLTRENVGLLERNFDHHWPPAPEGPDVDNQDRIGDAEFDVAFSHEFRITMTELGEFLYRVFTLGQEQDGPIKQMTRRDIIQSLCISLEWDDEKATSALGLLSLGPRDKFLKPPGGNSNDVYPWRHRRSWSFLWRPLVATGYDPDSLIMWGSRHIMSSFRYISNACSNGLIKAKSNRLKRALGRIREMKAKQFEDAVRSAVSELTGNQAHARLKKVGTQKIMADGKDLGDIDVLGVILSHRVILCIECKSLALARTPAEVRHQLDELVAGSDSKTSTMQKHNRRAKWVEEHLDQVLEFMGVEDRGRHWKVKPVLVSDSELLASYLTDTPIPVWSIETLMGMTVRDMAA